MAPTSAGALKSANVVRAGAGLRALPSSSTLRRSVNSKGMFQSKQIARRPVTRSVLEAPRMDQAATTGASLNPSEVLIEKLAAMGAPNDTDLHKMSDLADRLFLWDDVPKLGKCAPEPSLNFLHVSLMLLNTQSKSPKTVILMN